MNRCAVCVMPDSRPDTPFIDGICAACHNYAHRPQIDWQERYELLQRLLNDHHGEVIVPSSGGKDSTAQALTLIEMGAHVTAVTARTCHLTGMGRHNIDNLAKHCRTIELVPNMTKRAILNRLGLDLVGDPSWPEHVAIFTAPFKASAALHIPLIFYGENPQNQYGGPQGSEQARTMTDRWRHEFGGFLGLRPDDMIGQHGITARDMEDYKLSPAEMAWQGEAHFLGHYLPWDSHENAAKAIAAGMECATPSPANWWRWENLDNAQTGIHDYLMFLKYGYGRGCAQISVDVRAGRIDRQTALEWVHEHDGEFPERYMGLHIDEVLEPLGYNKQALQQLAQGFTNWANLV